MRKTLSLVGLLLIGLMLLMNPATGVVAGTETETDVAASVTTTTVTGDPPTDSDDESYELATTSTSTTTTTEAETTETTVTDDQTSTPSSVVGSAEDSEFGTFQVEVFFEDGEIVAVEALQLPTDRKSSAINNSAVPSYEAAVIAAQSSDIDVISGATVTWDKYTDSVQAALDEAGFVA